MREFGIDPDYTDRLTEVLALIAYQNPQNCPVSHFLSHERRETVADELNRCILGKYLQKKKYCYLMKKSFFE